MKHIFIVFVTLLLLGSSQEIFAINYKSDLPITEFPVKPNTKSNVSRAKLLCTHVANFKSNVADISSKYALDEDPTIIQTLDLVKEMYRACRGIQTQSIEKSDADEIITSILNNLSILNDGIRLHLKSEIGKIRKQHDKYGVAAQKIASHLDILIEKLEKKIYSKRLLNARDKNILKHIAKLKKTSRKLGNFSEIEFYKKSEIQASLLRLIKDIKKEIQNIRAL